MAAAYKCDRCKQFKDGAPSARLEVEHQDAYHLNYCKRERLGGDDGSRDMHLCGPCHVDVVKACSQPPKDAQ